MKNFFLFFVVAFAALQLNAQNVKNRFGFQADIKYGAGLANVKMMSGVSLSIGYNVTPSIYLGAGSSFNMISVPETINSVPETTKQNGQLREGTFYIVPIFARASYDIWPRKKMSAFATLDGGYSWTLIAPDNSAGVYSFFYGKWFVEPQLGVRYSKYFLSMGVNMLPYSYTRYGSITSINPLKSTPGVHKDGVAYALNFHLGVML